MDIWEIRVIFEYEFRRRSNARQTVRNMSDVFRSKVVNERMVQRWFQKFRAGDFCLQNMPRGKPETKVNQADLKAVVEKDPSQSTQELALKFNVSIPTIIDHLKQINKVKKLDRWVPY